MLGANRCGDSTTCHVVTDSKSVKSIMAVHGCLLGVCPGCLQFDEWDAANNADLAAWEKDTKRCSTASVQALGKPDEATDSLSVPQLSQLLATFNPFLQGDLPPLIQNGGGIVDKEEVCTLSLYVNYGGGVGGAQRP